MRCTVAVLCVFLAACNSPVTVSNDKGPKFQIVSDAKGGAVWRVNTTTGELWVCAPSDGKVACVKVQEDRPKDN